MRGNRDWTKTLTGCASVLGDLTASSVEPILAAEGLGIQSFDLLSAVRASGGREPLALIAARLGIVPSSLTEAVASAERKGLMERLTSGADRRVKRLMLTQRGDDLLDRCLRAVEACEDRIRSVISTSEIESAVDVLTRASEALQESN